MKLLTIIAMIFLMIAPVMVVPVFAGNILAEATDAVVEGVELSLLGGSPGLAVGLYWPIVHSSRLDVTAGPVIALGMSKVIAGGGVQFPVSIDLPVVGDIIDFGWIGGSYYSDTGRDNWKLEWGVGKTYEIEIH